MKRKLWLDTGNGDMAADHLLGQRIRVGPGKCLLLWAQRCRLHPVAEEREHLVNPNGYSSVVGHGARCRVRTCDFLRVKQALYH
jgi:hypothetical protein